MFYQPRLRLSSGRVAERSEAGWGLRLRPCRGENPTPTLPEDGEGESAVARVTSPLHMQQAARPGAVRSSPK